MNILLTGASGLIGRALLQRLLANGHTVRAVCRKPLANIAHPSLTWLATDMTALQSQDWRPLLDDIDVVINTVGIFRESDKQRFASVHVQAPAELFTACVETGVPRAIQLSALGAAQNAPTAYGRSKAEGDAALLALPLAATVLRPSLVYADAGDSSRLFRSLAAWPVLPVPADAGAVQPIHLDDLVDLIERLLMPTSPTPRMLAVVGPRPLAWVDYLQALRAGMGMAAAPVWRLPASLVGITARLATMLPASLLSPDSLAMLRAGSTAAAEPVSQLLGRPLRDPAHFTQPALAAAALWSVFRPLLLAVLAFAWLWTAWVSLRYRDVGVALLAAMGLTPALQTPALLLGAGLDAALGVLTLLRPSRRLWLAQFGLVLGYTLLISFWLPSWWLHPFGPISKNLPILALLAWLAAMEP